MCEHSRRDERKTSLEAGRVADVCVSVCLPTVFARAFLSLVWLVYGTMPIVYRRREREKGE